MTLQKKIIIETLLFAFFLDLIIIKVKDYEWIDFWHLDTYIPLLLFPAFFIFLATIVSYFISSLIKGKYVKKTFQQFLFWTLIPSFLGGLLFLYNLNLEINYKYRSANKLHNNQYLTFYADNRDKNISLAITSLQTELSDKGDYRIKRMRVLELDTFVNSKWEKYYDVQQIYCLGKTCNLKNTYASRQLVIGEAVKNIFVKESILDKIGSDQNKIIDSIVKNMATQKSFNTVNDLTSDLVTEVVKIKE